MLQVIYLSFEEMLLEEAPWVNGECVRLARHLVANAGTRTASPYDVLRERRCRYLGLLSFHIKRETRRAKRHTSTVCPMVTSMLTLNHVQVFAQDGFFTDALKIHTHLMDGLLITLL